MIEYGSLTAIRSAAKKKKWLWCCGNSTEFIMTAIVVQHPKSFSYPACISCWPLFCLCRLRLWLLLYQLLYKNLQQAYFPKCWTVPFPTSPEIGFKMINDPSVIHKMTKHAEVVLNVVAEYDQSWMKATGPPILEVILFWIGHWFLGVLIFLCNK